jgi:hypothetical protein
MFSTFTAGCHRGAHPGPGRVHRRHPDRVIPGGDLRRRRVGWPRRRRGDFASVEELVAAIGRFCRAWNQRCQPFVWVKDADEILARFRRRRPEQGL